MRSAAQHDECVSGILCKNDAI